MKSLLFCFTHFIYLSELRSSARLRQTQCRQDASVLDSDILNGNDKL